MDCAGFKTRQGPYFRYRLSDNKFVSDISPFDTIDGSKCPSNNEVVTSSSNINYNVVRLGGGGAKNVVRQKRNPVVAAVVARQRNKQFFIKHREQIHGV